MGNIEYLGGRIDDGKIFLPDEKVGGYADEIFDWLESPDPKVHRGRAQGILTWARGLSGPDVNPFLQEMLRRYAREIDDPDMVERIMGKAHGRLIKDE